MHIPGFTAERSLYGARRFRSSETAHPGLPQTGSVVPALDSSGGWESCLAGCLTGRNLDGSAIYDSTCASACELFAGGPGPTGPGGPGAGGGPAPTCTPHFSGCFLRNGKWVRNFTSQNCQVKVVACI
jgi:hypothetical protein